MTRAQSTPTGAAYYVVQQGDSLWDIAYRFHVSPADLKTANNINNADQIVIGQPLIIPGLEGLQGELTTLKVAYGDTLTSLSLHYHLSIAMLEQLNHLTSPNELYVGFSFVILKDNLPAAPGKRVALDVGQSLLELAVLSDTDQWAILAENRLDNSSQVLPGDVLHISGGEDNGSGGLPPAVSEVEISPLVQGKTADIQITGSEGLSLAGSFVDHPLNFFEDADHHYVTLQGIYSKEEPGLYPIEISGKNTSGAQFDYSQMVLISAGDYYFESIPSVDPKTLDPKITGPEDQLWSQLFSPVSPEKYWEGSFSLPVDTAFAGCYPSWFGARRSYNYSPYDYVHTGQDFCGQVGNPIYAAAAGVVVYTGELVVRGNATMIDHGWGVYTAYLHQSEILVKVGDRVEAGQLIGRVGNTGRVEGPHLHFEVIVGGVQVDPLDWLNQVFP